MVNSEIPDFEDFDAESQAILKNLYENNRILNFDNPNVRSLTKLEEIKTTQSFDEISNEIALSTPFGENSVFHSKFKETQQYERYSRDILSLMNKNCIDELYYTHNPVGNQSIGLIIHAQKSGKSLSLSFVPSSFTIEKELRYYSLLKEKCNQKVSVSSGGNFIIRNKDQPDWKTVHSGYSSSFPADTKYYQEKYSTNDFKVSLREIKQVYEDLLSRKDTVMLCTNYVDFNVLAKQIQLQLSKQFYNTVNVHVYIKQVDAKQKVIEETLLATNARKPFDVKLNITLLPNGQVTIRHVASDNLMKQYVNKWKKEAEARGLEINIEELRKQVIHDFESVEIEQSFYKRFIQSSKALFNEKIVGYVEGIQVTQKIGKNVWEEGTINESTWFTKDKEHVNWPKYAQFDPLVGGVTDGAIDEIAGIPLAIKGVYEIVTDEEKQQALLKIFTKEGAKQMLEGLADQARETLNDKDKAQHFGGKTVVSLATMLSGVGLFSKGATITDVADKTGDIASKIINPKAGEALNRLRLADRYKPEFLKAIEGYLEGADQKILGIIADKPNFDVVLREMAQQWRKFHGSKFILKNIEDRGEGFASQIRKFEARVIDEANFTADVQLDTGKFLEYKSWKKNSYTHLNGEQAQNQLKNYINNGDFEYIVDKQKLVNDGVPDPDLFVKERFQKIFKENADEWFKLDEAGGMITDKNILLNLFGTDDFNRIKGIIGDTSEEFYNKIIKVE